MVAVFIAFGFTYYFVVRRNNIQYKNNMTGASTKVENINNYTTNNQSSQNINN